MASPARPRTGPHAPRCDCTAPSDTAEYDLSLWLTKARALRSAWGTPARCRARVLAETPF